uniref:Uncharacterized protein n=1 Tax=Setaria viridis TaxID=4556 RepID=A0A4U6TFP3_SETVI|nr:hypothetical protein SEVIR_9G405300v2 [Setaria viridis]
MTRPDAQSRAAVPTLPLANQPFLAGAALLDSVETSSARPSPPSRRRRPAAGVDGEPAGLRLPLIGWRTEHLLLLAPQGRLPRRRQGGYAGWTPPRPETSVETDVSFGSLEPWIRGASWLLLPAGCWAWCVRHAQAQWRVLISEAPVDSFLALWSYGVEQLQVKFGVMESHHYLH